MPFRILSLDGGGIRGVISARILAAIEKRINQPLNEYFDLIAGTSTGAILATAIAIGRKPLPLSLIKSLTLTQLEQTLNAVSLTLIH